MSPNALSSRRQLHLLLFAASTAAELFYTGSSPAIQDPLTNPHPTICAVAQDQTTSDTFPWTHDPTCVTAVLPSSADHGYIGVHQDFCVYTNSAFNSGRGLSLVTTPKTAAELSYEVFSPYSDELAAEQMWEMKETDGKGQGLFATRRISTGETVILKSPVLLISQDVLSTPSRQRRHLLLETAVKQLPEKTRQLVLGLSGGGGGSEIENLIGVNAVRTKLWDGIGHLAIVPEQARINHACRQNSYYRFDDYTLNFDVFALKDIQPGEEITTSYGFSHLPRDTRLDALEANWGFTCTCLLCTANSTVVSTSNDRLSKIAELKDALPMDHDDLPQMLGLLPDLIALMEKEDFLTEIAMYEEILAYTWSTFGIDERAKYWAGRARKHWAVVAGKESWEAKRIGELEDDVKSHGTWAKWEGDPWEGVGKGHPWDETHDHDHDHDHEH